MPSVVATSYELLVNPRSFFRRLNGSREAGRMALLTVGVMVVYYCRTTGLGEQIRYVLGPTGQWDRNSVRYVLLALTSSLTQALAVVMLFAGVIAPVALLVASRIRRRESLSALMRDRYFGVLGTALGAWSLSLLLMFLPSVFFFPSALPRLAPALGVAPLPTFALLMIIGVGEQLEVRRRAAVAVVLAAAPPLVFVPFLGTLLVVILYSPLFALMIFLVVRELLIGHLARWQRKSSSATGLANDARQALLAPPEGRSYEGTSRP